MAEEVKSWPDFVGKDGKEIEAQLNAEGIQCLSLTILLTDRII
jgi:hypothetical protein